MKIRKLEILGFKSFLDKANISFPPGVSAIVGPNGCGKSNVIDALRWVMGEQSVKQLRGKNMEDVIFSGANGKPPLNMAEVTLTLANDNGHAPEEFHDYAEISVTRRLFRSGESAYLINKQPCRLKDIYNLFMGSGVGSRTFAIIQQGNIGAIIDAGPDERRLFLEEAAGVTRYKLRKTEALRKVKATEQNLLRLNDIIAEVNRQMAGLHRQAKKAERYKTYQERIQVIDCHLILHQYDDFSRQITETDQLLRSLRDTDFGHMAQLKKIDAAVETIKLTRWQKSQEITAQKNDQYEIQRSIDRIETERRHLKDETDRLSKEVSALSETKNDLAAKTDSIGSETAQVLIQNQALQQEITEYKSEIDSQRAKTQEYQGQLNELNQQLEKSKSRLLQLVADEARYKNIYQNTSTNKDNLKRRLKRIDEEVALAGKKVAALTQSYQDSELELTRIQQKMVQQQSRIDELKTRLGERATQLGAAVKESHELDLDRNKSRSQLSALKKMAANFDWYRDGVKAIMRAHQAERPAAGDPIVPGASRLTGIAGLMADVIEPEPGYEAALEAVLGETLQYILVQDQPSAMAAIDFLQNSGAGRCGFIPITGVKPLNGDDSKQIEDAHRLLQHVTVAQPYAAIVNALLGHVAVTATREDALNLFNRNGRIQSVVSLAGDVVTHQGLLLGGSRNQLSGILTKKQELKKLEQHCLDLDRQTIAAQKTQLELEKVVRALESELQQCLSEKNDTARDALEAEKNHYRIGEDFKNSQRHAQIARLEQEQLMGEESDIDAELTKYQQALSDITAEVQQAQEQTTATSQQLGRISSQWEEHNQQVINLKLSLTALSARLENGQHTLRRLQAFEHDSRERLDLLIREIELKKQKHAVALEKLSSGEQSLHRLYDSLKELEARLSSQECDYHATDQALQDHDKQLTAIKSSREETLEKIRLVELDLSEKKIKRENIAVKAHERYHGTIADLRMRRSQSTDIVQMSLEEMQKQLERFRAGMEAIGDVHLGAIKEFEELKTRFDFLSTQRDDLVKAIDDLQKVIRRINRITQQRFMETYEQVNDKLKEVFPKLFDGGSAQLELTDPGKPLETGVEFLVHPPGKKLTRMSLLSGGEKALSAIAFIFAIFLLRPATFCLLDEIDAPLDESNVIRFNNLMQVVGQKSQIVMITHNKKSMEFADMLYGVTMEHKGISKIVSVNLSGKA